MEKILPHQVALGHGIYQAIETLTNPRIKGVMERSSGFVPCNRVSIPEESSGEARADQLQKKPRAAIAVAWTGLSYRLSLWTKPEVPLPKPFGAQRSMNARNLTLNFILLRFWVCFDSIMIMPWLFPLGIKKYLTIFNFIENYT